MALPRTLVLMLGLSPCLLALAAPAYAQQDPEIVVTAMMKMPEGHEPVRMVIGIKDLNLATVVGANRLEKRVSTAIDRFCGAPPRAPLWQVKDSKACSDHAWASARPQMDSAIRRANSN